MRTCNKSQINDFHFKCKKLNNIIWLLLLTCFQKALTEYLIIRKHQWNRYFWLKKASWWILSDHVFILHDCLSVCMKVISDLVSMFRAVSWSDRACIRLYIIICLIIHSLIFSLEIKDIWEIKELELNTQNIKRSSSLI